MSAASDSSPAPVTVLTLRRMREAGERFACLTAYDASFARLLDGAGVDVILVGDSLGMVVQGRESTLAVSVDEMVYHTRAAARGRRRALLMADLPFMSYATVEQALGNAARLMAEGGAHMVKLEGGRLQAQTVQALTQRGIPVCAHLGLTPQSVHKLGGYRVQGRGEEAGEAMVDDALALQEAGADVLLLECVPGALARRIVSALHIPVIGIGAGPDCHGQVLVLYDVLGLTAGRMPRFARNFLGQGGDLHGAVAAYVQAVREGSFPGPEHGYE